jgi:glutamate/tyrosine decarboxylase-like PLP-dependent enzyme
MALSRRLFAAMGQHPEMEAVGQTLSIATFRYIPSDLRAQSGSAGDYLNTLNREILLRLQREGDVLISNAVVDGVFLLRACIVNFRASEADVDALPEIVACAGRAVDRELRAKPD